MTRPDTASEIAAGLRAVADQLATLGDLPMPATFVCIDILPHGGEDNEVAAIDRIGQVLTGTPGQARQMSDGSYHHGVKAHVNGITVNAFTSVTSPDQRRMQAEIDRLRAQLAEQRA
jgi:hypothetical protein